MQSYSRWGAEHGSSHILKVCRDSLDFLIWKYGNPVLYISTYRDLLDRWYMDPDTVGILRHLDAEYFAIDPETDNILVLPRGEYGWSSIEGLDIDLHSLVNHLNL